MYKDNGTTYSQTDNSQLTPKKQSIAEILASVQNEHEENRLVQISPLVSPLKICSSSQGNAQVELDKDEDQDNLSEIIESDIKFGGLSLLHVACSRGHDDIVSYLLTQGCDLNARTMETEDTPLHVASRWGHPSTVELLLRNGAQAGWCNNVKSTALDLAMGR